MPKRAKELPAIAVARLTAPGFYAVGGVAGLHLQVSRTGARSWILRAMVGSRRRDIGLGAFPDVPLARAREKARETRDVISAGGDPVAERKASRDRLAAAQARGITFDKAAERYIASQSAAWRNGKHRQQWENTLTTYASPAVGKLPVDQIELGHVLKILEPIWTTKTETAKRLRGRIENVLAWSTTHGHRTGDNPARWRGHLDTILPAPGKVARVQHFRALAVDGMHAFVEALRERQGFAARAVEFTILTAARSGEVRGATWDEIDLEAKVWTVPGNRMKADREHVKPLSDAAIALIKALPRVKGTDFVFPGTGNRPLSDMSLGAVLRRMGVEATVHGFRSTFRDWCAERTNYSHEVAEMALAHAVGNRVEAAYRRGDLLEKRHRLMRDWARFLVTTPKAGKVVALRRARA